MPGFCDERAPRPRQRAAELVGSASAAACRPRRQDQRRSVDRIGPPGDGGSPTRARDPGPSNARSAVRATRARVDPWSTNATGACDLASQRSGAPVRASSRGSVRTACRQRSPFPESSTGAPSSTTPATRSGCVSAVSSATRAPCDMPTIATRSRLRRRSSDSMSRASSTSDGDPDELPNPRRSNRITRNIPDQSATCGCHMSRSSAQPWTSSTGNPCPRPDSAALRHRPR